MKAAIIFYSRDGTTREVAKYLKEQLKCDVEELIDTKNRAGPIGWVMSGRDANMKTPAVLKPTKLKAEDYDLIILGTPNWVNKMAPALRTYITTNKSKIKEFALITTKGGSKGEKPNEEMAKLLGKKPKATLDVKTKEVKSGEFKKKADKFASKLK